MPLEHLYLHRYGHLPPLETPPPATPSTDTLFATCFATPAASATPSTRWPEPAIHVGSSTKSITGRKKTSSRSHRLWGNFDDTMSAMRTPLRPSPLLPSDAEEVALPTLFMAFVRAQLTRSAINLSFNKTDEGMVIVGPHFNPLMLQELCTRFMHTIIACPHCHHENTQLYATRLRGRDKQTFRHCPHCQSTTPLPTAFTS
jgi:hypothetical protein